MDVFGKLAVSALVLSVASVASAASVSGSTDFRVTLPEILVLYHWEDAHLKLTSDNSVVSDSAAREESFALTNGGSYTINTDVKTTGANILSDKVSVKLENSWAVRSLSNAAVKLDLVVQKDTLKNQTKATSIIKVGDATLAAPTAVAENVTGVGTKNMTIASGWAPVMGDINFTLDLSAANNSGEYNSRGAVGKNSMKGSADDTFLLRLTGNVTP